jgi:hypothetical protein
MIDKFKKWLGIEGVKLELLVPEEASKSGGFVDGRIILTSMQPQTVSSITVKMYERYTRGRGKDEKTDEYEIGTITLSEPLKVPAHQEVAVDFALPFTLVTSSVDDFGKKNLLTKGIAQAAKAIHGTRSEFKVVAHADVNGTALDPFDEKWVILK